MKLRFLKEKCISWRFIIWTTNHHPSLPADLYDNAQHILTHTLKLISCSFWAALLGASFPPTCKTVGQSGRHSTSAAPPIMSCCCDCQLQHRLKEELSGGWLQENWSEQCNNSNKNKTSLMCLDNVKYPKGFLLNPFVRIFLEFGM